MARATADPFWWETDEGSNDARVRCHGCDKDSADGHATKWAGPWRNTVLGLREDEAAHACPRAVAWRRERKEDPRVALAAQPVVC